MRFVSVTIVVFLMCFTEITSGQEKSQTPDFMDDNPTTESDPEQSTMATEAPAASPTPADAPAVPAAPAAPAASGGTTYKKIKRTRKVIRSG
jgi:hypothetical protein